MAMKPGDKAVITHPDVEGSTTVHLVVRTYDKEAGQKIAIACYCHMFVEGKDLEKTDNEQAITCKHCLHELACV